ncbi:MAG: hypothetical protein FWF97_03920, partial [Alphaproteobacteria bacterium]|nr:hypothetical protein [Alphaproteobacteria bacterium]
MNKEKIIFVDNMNTGRTDVHAASSIRHSLFFILYSLFFILCIGAADAAVVSRPTAAAPAASRGRPAPAAAATPRATSVVAAPAAQPVVEEVVVVEATPAPVVVEEIALPPEDKALRFDEVLQGSGGGSAASESELKNLIAAQRTAGAASEAIMLSASSTGGAVTGARGCDDGLRACMKDKCGENFEKCATDGDTAWGDKIDSCRRGTACTSEEYNALAPEIKADRDAFLTIGSFDKVLNCGIEYNECIVAGCGQQLNACKGKAAGDKVIADCKKIADRCREQDSGLAARAMEVFATLRIDAEKQIKADEQKLYALRDKMSELCRRTGAMFDDRSYECVFTVELTSTDSHWRTAANPSGLVASQKLHPSATYDCDPGWFGIDVTTFIENAFRLTRSQTAASSAMLGAGVGTGVGAITNNLMTTGQMFGGTSKAQDDRDNAKKALEDECENQGGVIVNSKCSFDPK